MVQVPAPARPFSLGQAVAASSFFPADILADFSRELSRSLGFLYQFWPPSPGGSATPPETEEMLIGDGGLCENTLITSLVRRQVERIVWATAPSKPLQQTWDPYERPPRDDDIDESFPSYFGVFTGGAGQIGWTYKNNQIFAKEDFAPLIARMQESQRNGTGAVASATLTTVANPWYEVEAGRRVRITVIYLSRAWRWEESLPEDLQREIVPESEEARRDMGQLRRTGEFADFPNYSTVAERYTARKVNALDQLSSWVLREHASQITATLQGPLAVN